MPTHEQITDRIIKQLKERKSTKPVSLKKKAVSHEVPKPGDKRHSDEKIDLSDLNEILHINTEKRICIAEPGVTFIDLVTATMKYGLVPIIVPELKTITIGGAVAGCSIESMSYKHGGFHDTCLEYEIITAKGDVLICTNVLIFGYYSTGSQQDQDRDWSGKVGKYEAIVCGDELTHELWVAAKDSFAKHDGQRKSDQEPEKRTLTTSNTKKAKPDKITFVREDHKSGMRPDLTKIYRIYKGPDAASAKESCKQKIVLHHC